MSFLLTSAITIGAFKNVKVNDVKIVRSVHSFVETAVIKIPAVARLKQKGKPQTNVDQALLSTTNLMKVGDRVTIDLGYNGDNNAEFSGFIRRVNFTQPVELECEGFSWLLRNKSYQKTFASITLRELLNFICEGTEVRVSSEVPDVNLGKVLLMDKSTAGAVNGAQVLDMLKDQYKLSVYFRNFNALYAGLEQTPEGNAVKYKMGWNVIRGQELKWHTNDDIKLKVVVMSGKKDGSHLTASAGDDGGSITTINLPYGLDQSYLEDMAQEALRKAKYDGYQGKINTLLQPFVIPGDEAQITDPRYTERSGNYFVDSVEVHFSTQGARRMVGIGESLDA